MNRVLLFLTIILLNETTFGAESGMPQLNPESFSSQLFWLFVFFTILFISINNYFVPKIMKVRNKREETINSLIATVITTTIERTSYKSVSVGTQSRMLTISSGTALSGSICERHTAVLKHMSRHG